jgi:glycosyltransferase involved in cell wall biosynthesis
VHDWLTGMRGGEKVLQELCRLFPEARVYTMIWFSGSVAPQIEERVVQTSFLQRLTGLTDYRNLLPLFPAAIRSLQVRNADLVISSSHAVAKGVRIPKGARHLCYLHTPMRYLWDDSGSYFAFGKGRRWKRAALGTIKPYLRRFDLHSCRTIDRLLANSATVRRRAEQVYLTRAEVVYPPVDIEFFHPDGRDPLGDYYLAVSALEPYKRIDLAIEAFRRIDRRLVVAGDGTLAAELRKSAPPNVELVGRVSDGELRALYRGCRAFILPGVEDFGMTVVEAQACGRPVICFGRGGAMETVIDGVTGVHFIPDTPEALRRAVLLAEQRDWHPGEIRRSAERFSADRFRSRMREVVAEMEAPR